jgi:hypothetical protein
MSKNSRRVKSTMDFIVKAGGKHETASSKLHPQGAWDSVAKVVPGPALYIADPAVSIRSKWTRELKRAHSKA